MNHRIGLFDAILVKENHIAAAGSIAAAVAAGRKLNPKVLLEVEVETFDELRQALDAKVDRIMLDNFELDDMRKAVQIARHTLIARCRWRLRETSISATVREHRRDRHRLHFDRRADEAR